MLGVSNGVAGWTLSDMELWNMNETSSGDESGDNPTTGTMMPIVTLIVLATGSTVIVANTRKRRR